MNNNSNKYIENIKVNKYIENIKLKIKHINIR